MGRVLKILAVSAMACWLAGAQAASWRQVPVPGAAVNDLVVLPNGELYAGTNNGVYHSQDAGTTWVPTQNAPPSKAFLRMHVVDGDPQWLVAYAQDTTRYGGLALEVSRDGGATWRVTHTGALYLPSGDFTSHSSVPGVILFTQAHIVLRSEDGGMTWADLSTNQAKRNVFAIKDQPDRFVGMVWRVDRLLESNDGGVTWTGLDLQSQLPQSDYLRFEQDPVQPSLLYFAAYQTGGQAARSGKVNTRTGEVSFFEDACGCSHVRVVADPHRAGRLIAPSVAFDPATLAVTGRPLRESLDGGVTWHTLGGLPRKLEDEYRWRFDPWRPGRIYLPTAGAGIYRSDNDGGTFIPRYEGMKAGMVADLSVDPANPASFLVVRQLLPMLYSSDGGSNFSTVRMNFYSDLPVANENRSRIARAWTDPNVLMGFDKEAFYRSEDGGLSWQRVPSDFPFAEVWINAIQFAGSGSDKIVALTERAEVGSQMYWSTDGGRHWTSADFGSWAFVNRLGSGGDDFGPVYARRENYYSEEATLWSVDTFGGVPRFVSPPSSDMFLRWTMSAPDPGNTSRMLAFSENWSLQSRPKRVWETVDGGSTWNAFGATDFAGGIPIVDACDGRTVWESITGRVSRDSGRAFRSEVGIAQYLANGFHALCFEGESHLFAAINGGVAIREPEAGDTLLKEGHDP